MKKYKQEFIKFMVRSQVLIFGDFTTKSGRKTPFFINTGNYNNSQQISQLGYYYAKTIIENKLTNASTLYGPAYKGIPLCITTSIALQNYFQKNIHFCFNRKKTKNHGETGTLIGHKLNKNDNVIIIDDVITAGTTIRENIPLIKLFNANVQAVIISVDRIDKGQGNLSALEEIKQEFNIPIYPIVNLTEIIEYLHNRPIDNKIIINDKIKKQINLYQQKYSI